MIKKADKKLPPQTNFTTSSFIDSSKKEIMINDFGQEYYFSIFGHTYYGVVGENFIFGTEKENDSFSVKQFFNKSETLFVSDTTPIIFMIDALSDIKFNRLFLIELENNQGSITDLLTEKTKFFKTKSFIKEKISFNLYSDILFFLKFNKKTISKKHHVIYFKDFLLVTGQKKDKDRTLSFAAGANLARTAFF